MVIFISGKKDLGSWTFGKILSREEDHSQITIREKYREPYMINAIANTATTRPRLFSLANEILHYVRIHYSNLTGSFTVVHLYNNNIMLCNRTATYRTEFKSHRSPVAGNRPKMTIHVILLCI